MKPVIPLFIVALFLSGCGRGTTFLSEEEVARYAPDTTRRVERLRDLPIDVAAAVASDLGLRELQDRGAYWTGGCSAGAKLLEAGQRKNGWWVFYKLGGIVDSKRLAQVDLRDGQMHVSSTTILR